ncbi:MAG: hypothetical protein WCP06_11540 [Verrucomicrobiota bacterium]
MPRGRSNLDATKYTSVTRNLTYNLNSNLQLGTATSASVLTIQGTGNGSFNIGGIISELKAGGGGVGSVDRLSDTNAKGVALYRQFDGLDEYDGNDGPTGA